MKATFVAIKALNGVSILYITCGFLGFEFFTLLFDLIYLIYLIYLLLHLFKVFHKIFNKHLSTFWKLSYYSMNGSSRYDYFSITALM
jgi:hypothetical protein